MNSRDYIKLLETIFDSVYEGILVTDPNKKIIFYNNELAKWENLSKKDVLGKHLMDVYDVTEQESDHIRVTESGEPLLEKHKHIIPKNGKKIDIIANTIPFFKDGKLLCVYSICRNVTQIKELLEKTIQLQGQIGLEIGTDKRNGTRYTFESIIHRNSKIAQLIDSAKKAAESDCAVLVYGETGTGKELLVQGLHNYSSHSQEPFIAINCAAIPETLLESSLFGTVKGAFTGAVDNPGLFEQAGKGTLFLDEINSMSPALQAKLLRVLQEKYVRRLGGKTDIPIYCRVISSINVDPWECISRGELRKDLFYRIAVISLYVPPLRERKDDIDILIDYFLKKFQKIYGRRSIKISPEMRIFLMKYQWPGNVRELEHVIESAITMLGEDKIIKTDHLPQYLKIKLSQQEQGILDITTREPGTLSHILAEVESQAIKEALRKYQGNITKAAAALGISRQNMQYRMRKLGIKGQKA
ncbi:MAG: sigma-54 interaction domain-containing protein [Bacillota bacterium]|jgi:arginine utilization regulatory protein